MRPRFRDATHGDAAAIAGLRNAVSGALTARHGDGHWSSLVSERVTERTVRDARVRVGRTRKGIVTVLALARRKPPSIKASLFTPVPRPLHLTGMAVAVAVQGLGLGSLAIADACAVARAWPADAIRLDAYDADAGATEFYKRCGFEERGRATYRGTPLVYLELVL